MVPTLAEPSRRSPRAAGRAAGPRPVGSPAPRSEGEPGVPVRVGIVDDCELVRRGLAGMLEAHRHRVQLVRAPRLRDEVGPAVDLVLYDPALLAPEACEEVERLARRRGARAVVFTWQPDPVPTRGDGATSPVLSKCWDAEQMVAQLERAADDDAAWPVPVDRAERVSAASSEAPAGPPTARRRAGGRELPGGLTEREAQIVDLISRGLSNDEVARACYLSINSIKTYIRTAYRKMGVTRRSQAVVWGLEHGLGGPDSPVTPVPGMPTVPGQRPGV